MPSSKAELSISVDSLLKLPADAVYTRHSGQATATVSKEGEVIYVAATCDSLEREVEYYEELYYRARDALEQKERELNSVQTEAEQQSSNLLVKLITLFWMGFAAGALTIIFIIIFKRHGK